MGWSEDETDRYSRQTRLPEWGDERQERLRSASIAVVGAGGLGSPTLMYLAAAGVGRLGVIDDDRVAVSNLHRQIIHQSGAVGSPKSASAGQRIHELNPHVEVVEHADRLLAWNVREVLAPYDVVVDGSDSFATRYLVNDACRILGIPLVWASVLGFDGQLSVFQPGGPCLRCLFPSAPAAGAVPSCAEAGVIGFVPGMLGVAQAAEAIKLVAGVGQSMAGRVGVYDGLAGRWSELPLQADPECPTCAPGARPELVDLVERCSVPDRALTADDLAAWLSERQRGERTFTLVDLRDEEEGALLPGAVRVPMRVVQDGGAPSGTVVVYCQRGGRSARTLEVLLQAEVDAYHLAGGAVAWQARSAPDRPDH